MNRIIGPIVAIAVAVVVAAMLAQPGALLGAVGVGAMDTAPVKADALPPDVQAELDRLPPGTIIVPCNPSVAVLPEGVRPLTPLGFSFAHPGFRYLSHGYCADNPNATPIPMKIPVVDGAPGEQVTLTP